MPKIETFLADHLAADLKKLRKHHNPSYPVAPHCTIKPRNCYCMRKDGLMICPVNAYTDSCFENLVVLVVKKPVKEKRPAHYFTEKKKVIEYERLTDKEVFEGAKTFQEKFKREDSHEIV
jgi:hypothetical protein